MQIISCFYTRWSISQTWHATFQVSHSACVSMEIVLYKNSTTVIVLQTQGLMLPHQPQIQLHSTGPLTWQSFIAIKKMNNHSYFLCWAEERRVQMSATITTTTTVMAPTDTTMMTRRLLFFWGVALPWGGRIWPIGDSGRCVREERENKKSFKANIQ